MYEQFNFVKMGGFRSGYIGGDMEFGVPMLIVLGSVSISYIPLMKTWNIVHT